MSKSNVSPKEDIMSIEVEAEIVDFHKDTYLSIKVRFENDEDLCHDCTYIADSLVYCAKIYFSQFEV